MRSIAIVLCVCFLVGCGADPKEALQETSHEVSPKSSMSFRQQQEFLFHGIDHKQVCQGCQELLRLHREGKLSARTYYCDDSTAKLSELPESVRALRPTSIEINELMVNMTFLSADGVQHLQCVSNEFGEPVASEGNVKGSGFRTNPYGMDRLSGTESLDDLNANYKHFQMTLAPGLTYQVYDDEPPSTIEEIKRKTEGMAQMFDMVQDAVQQLMVKRQRLLYRTDHPALLDACRDLVKRVDEGAISSPQIDILPEAILRQTQHIDREKYAEDLKQIPQIILDLEPCRISIDKDRVTIALAGGLDHAGVFAYVDGNDPEPRSDTMKLIDGLWYYDDGIKEGGDEYREYLKSLEHEILSPVDWRRKQENLPLPQKN